MTRVLRSVDLGFGGQRFLEGMRPEIEQVVCSGGAVMHNRSFDGPQQTSQQRIETADLSIHVPSGDLNASGPGRVLSVRRGLSMSVTVTPSAPRLCNISAFMRLSPTSE